MYQLILKTLIEWEAPFAIKLCDHFGEIELFTLSDNYVVLKVKKHYDKPLHAYTDMVRFVRNNQDEIHKALITSSDSDMFEKANFLDSYYQLEGLITDIDYSTIEEYYGDFMIDVVRFEDFTYISLEIREPMLLDPSDFPPHPCG